MKKTKFLAIPVLAAMVFAGCASAPAEPVNKAPTVVGVKDIECMVNSTVDFLDGVAALDNEDGDITPALEITVSPEVAVEDGYAYFSRVGAYTVNYTVKDSGGRTAQKRAYVDVVDRETYKTFNMPEGFTVEAYGAAKVQKAGMENGSFKLVAEGGEIAEDVILTRSYPINDTYYPEGGEYTFNYVINSNKQGKVKFIVNGDDCAEMYLTEGDNNLQFSYLPKGSGDIKADLCLGNLGDMDITVKSVESQYPQQENKRIERAEDFKFGGKLEARIDTKAGYSTDEQNADPTLNNGLAGNAWAADGGNEAHFEVTSPSKIEGTAWAGGMFVNTGIELKAGESYEVSMDVSCIRPEDRAPEEDIFEIQFLYKQWSDDSEVIGKIFHETGKVSQTLKIDESHAGSLWIYVMSGTQINEIILKNLKVTEVLSASSKNSYAIEDYKANGGQIATKDGGFTFTVAEFKESGGDTAVESPSFNVSGSGANYVLTFKAKASAPVDVVVAIPVANGWDPTILWQQIKLSQDETIYTFLCNKNDADRMHKIAWQFGSSLNTQYRDVTIEISDVRICLKNNQLDN